MTAACTAPLSVLDARHKAILDTVLGFVLNGEPLSPKYFGTFRLVRVDDAEWLQKVLGPTPEPADVTLFSEELHQLTNLNAEQQKRLQLLKNRLSEQAVGSIGK